ncbi:hypothetical protein IEQ34_001407 [Dendrobium chrysotoxum]|uniref:Uncharacterized protein n=1 Tax=Dendrobium chrysotoxum TaxID=161865 RepID=A0AAV7HPZ0_DENCH|nr:hypothetical protein IEQ34_001407 [Dendrobium chrysotoxum]
MDFCQVFGSCTNLMPVENWDLSIIGNSFLLYQINTVYIIVHVGGSKTPLTLNVVAVSFLIEIAFSNDIGFHISYQFTLVPWSIFFVQMTRRDFCRDKFCREIAASSSICNWNFALFFCREILLIVFLWVFLFLVLSSCSPRMLLGSMEISPKYKQLWNKWDVRVLILLSLSIQIILIFLGRLRRTSTSRWI